jgi:hypothetical protein
MKIVTRPPIEPDTFVKQTKRGNHCPASYSNSEELEFSRYVYRKRSAAELGNAKGWPVPAAVSDFMLYDHCSTDKFGSFVVSSFRRTAWKESA